MLVPVLVRALQGKREQTRDFSISWWYSFSQKVNRFQIQEKLIFPFELETRKSVMSQLKGCWAGLTFSCLWRVTLWFSGMKTVYTRECISQLPITTTNAWSKSTYKDKRLTLRGCQRFGGFSAWLVDCAASGPVTRQHIMSWVCHGDSCSPQEEHREGGEAETPAWLSKAHQWPSHHLSQVPQLLKIAMNTLFLNHSRGREVLSLSI